MTTTTTPTKPTAKRKGPIEDFRAACAEAEKVYTFGSLEEAREKADATRQAIRECLDEGKAIELGKELAEAEARVRVLEIRIDKAQEAWTTAKELARPAIQTMADRIEDAAEEVPEALFEIINSILCPESREDDPETPYTFSAGSTAAAAHEHLSEEALASGRAWRVRHELRNRLVANFGEHAAHYCRSVLELLASAERALPEIKAQSDQLLAIRAAVLKASK